jgi:hypothetical protein
MRSLYFTTNRHIIKQYVRCISKIVRYDYPELWPEFLPQIVEYILKGQAGDGKAIVTGLLGLKALVKNYENSF